MSCGTRRRCAGAEQLWTSVDSGLVGAGGRDAGPSAPPWYDETVRVIGVGTETRELLRTGSPVFRRVVLDESCASPPRRGGETVTIGAPRTLRFVLRRVWTRGAGSAAGFDVAWPALACPADRLGEEFETATLQQFDASLGASPAAPGRPAGGSDRDAGLDLAQLEAGAPAPFGCLYRHRDVMAAVLRDALEARPQEVRATAQRLILGAFARAYVSVPKQGPGSGASAPDPAPAPAPGPSPAPSPAPASAAGRLRLEPRPGGRGSLAVFEFLATALPEYLTYDVLSAAADRAVAATVDGLLTPEVFSLSAALWAGLAAALRAKVWSEAEREGDAGAASATPAGSADASQRSERRARSESLSGAEGGRVEGDAGRDGRREAEAAGEACGCSGAAPAPSGAPEAAGGGSGAPEPARAGARAGASPGRGDATLAAGPGSGGAPASQSSSGHACAGAATIAAPPSACVSEQSVGKLEPPAGSAPTSAPPSAPASASASAAAGRAPRPRPSPAGSPPASPSARAVLCSRLAALGVFVLNSLSNGSRWDCFADAPSRALSRGRPSRLWGLPPIERVEVAQGLARASCAFLCACKVIDDVDDAAMRAVVPLIVDRALYYALGRRDWQSLCVVKAGSLAELWHRRTDARSDPQRLRRVVSQSALLHELSIAMLCAPARDAAPPAPAPGMPPSLHTEFAVAAFSNLLDSLENLRDVSIDAVKAIACVDDLERASADPRPDPAPAPAPAPAPSKVRVDGEAPRGAPPKVSAASSPDVSTPALAAPSGPSSTPALAAPSGPDVSTPALAAPSGPSSTPALAAPSGPSSTLLESAAAPRSADGAADADAASPPPPSIDSRTEVALRSLAAYRRYAFASLEVLLFCLERAAFGSLRDFGSGCGAAATGGGGGGGPAASWAAGGGGGPAASWAAGGGGGPAASWAAGGAAASWAAAEAIPAGSPATSFFRDLGQDVVSEAHFAQCCLTVLLCSRLVDLEGPSLGFDAGRFVRCRVARLLEDVLQLAQPEGRADGAAGTRAEPAPRAAAAWPDRAETDAGAAAAWPDRAETDAGAAAAWPDRADAFASASASAPSFAAPHAPAALRRAGFAPPSALQAPGSRRRGFAEADDGLSADLASGKRLRPDLHRQAGFADRAGWVTAAEAPGAAQPACSSPPSSRDGSPSAAAAVASRPWAVYGSAAALQRAMQTAVEAWIDATADAPVPTGACEPPPGAVDLDAAEPQAQRLLESATPWVDLWDGFLMPVEVASLDEAAERSEKDPCACAAAPSSAFRAAQGAGTLHVPASDPSRRRAPPPAAWPRLASGVPGADADADAAVKRERLASGPATLARCDAARLAGAQGPACAPLVPPGGGGGCGGQGAAFPLSPLSPAAAAPLHGVPFDPHASAPTGALPASSERDALRRSAENAMDAAILTALQSAPHLTPHTRRTYSTAAATIGRFAGWSPADSAAPPAGDKGRGIFAVLTEPERHIPHMFAFYADSPSALLAIVVSACCIFKHCDFLREKFPEANAVWTAARARASQLKRDKMLNAGETAAVTRARSTRSGGSRAAERARDEASDAERAFGAGAPETLAAQSLGGSRFVPWAKGVSRLGQDAAMHDSGARGSGVHGAGMHGAGSHDPMPHGSGPHGFVPQRKDPLSPAWARGGPAGRAPTAVSSEPLGSAAGAPSGSSFGRPADAAPSGTLGSAADAPCAAPPGTERIATPPFVFVHLSALCAFLPRSLGTEHDYPDPWDDQAGMHPPPPPDVPSLSPGMGLDDGHALRLLHPWVRWFYSNTRDTRALERAAADLDGSARQQRCRREAATRRALAVGLRVWRLEPLERLTAGRRAGGPEVAAHYAAYDAPAPLAQRQAVERLRVECRGLYGILESRRRFDAAKWHL